MIPWDSLLWDDLGGWSPEVRAMVTLSRLHLDGDREYRFRGEVMHRGWDDLHRELSRVSYI